MQFKRLLSAVLCAAVLLGLTACADTTSENTPVQTETTTIYPSQNEPHLLGEGDTMFSLSVTHFDGEEVKFEISTSETTVGGALSEVGLIEGEQGPYGLMVTTVNGEVHRYELDKTYWSFYIDGTYAMTGVDETDIEPGQSYALCAEQM